MAKSKKNKGIDILRLIMRIVLIILIFVFILCIFKTCVDCMRERNNKELVNY